MPRRGRLFIPGGCYHVLGRGLERRYIFEDVADKRDFLSRFGASLRRNESQCLAWALMSNHYHFLIRTGTRTLSSLMAPVLGGFASFYNRRHERVGYVFQNRFTSILCDEDSYLLALVRYIHLNPLRAGMIASIAELGRYPWTGHAGVLGRYRQDWHDTVEVLRCFGERRGDARRSYARFMMAGAHQSAREGLPGGGLLRSYGGWESVSKLRREHIVCIGDERILGESDFVAKVLQKDELRIESRTRLTREGWTLDKLLDWVCTRYRVEQSRLYIRSRNNTV